VASLLAFPWSLGFPSIHHRLELKLAKRPPKVLQNLASLPSLASFGFLGFPCFPGFLGPGPWALGCPLLPREHEIHWHERQARAP